MEDTNSNYNSIRYTSQEWSLVRQSFRRSVWTIPVIHVADIGGERTVYKSRVRRWVYDHELGPLLLVVLVSCATMMTITGIIIL
jgi:hypothetical protein